jgi:hypothetical protein
MRDIIHGPFVRMTPHPWLSLAVVTLLAGAIKLGSLAIVLRMRKT